MTLVIRRVGGRKGWRTVAGALLTAALVAGCSSDDGRVSGGSSVDASGLSTDESGAPARTDTGGSGTSTTDRSGASTTTSTQPAGTSTSSSAPAAVSSTTGAPGSPGASGSTAAPSPTAAPAPTAPPVGTAAPAPTVAPTTRPSTVTTTVPPTAPPPVVAAEPPVPPAEPTTTLGPVAPALELRADGIGPATFGQPAESVLATLAPQFGAVASDTTISYPTAMGDGTFASEDGTAFVAILGRFVCFENQLCLNFGGEDEASLVWLGWSLYGGDTEVGPVLATAQGVRPGVTWASVASLITVEPDGCYTVGYGTTGDIELELLSPDAWFGTMGSPEPAEDTTPDPADVVIITMSAGAQDVFLGGDC